MYRSIFAIVGWMAVVSHSVAGTANVRVNDSVGKPLADAVVFLESAAAKAANKPLTGIEVAQVAKQFVPLVTVVPAGSMVHFPNRDTVRHHVYSFSAAKNFELKLYTGTPANPVLFDKPGIVVLGCNIHDSMAAWVLVVETPYFGKTNAAGDISLLNIPAGNYRLRTWHADLPVGAVPQDQPVIIGATEVVNAVVKLSKP
jgi:plastocyanin